MLTIVGDARSIVGTSLHRRSILAQRCQRSAHKFLDMLVAFRIAECRRARGPIAVASLFLAAKLGKKIAAR
jgi:hypothetical protein